MELPVSDEDVQSLLGNNATRVSTTTQRRRRLHSVAACAAGNGTEFGLVIRLWYDPPLSPQQIVDLLLGASEGGILAVCSLAVVDESSGASASSYAPPSLPPPAAPPAAPPYNAIFFVQQANIDQPTAMAACEARGGRLAVLDTAQKQAEASAIRPSSWAGWVAAVAPAGDGVWGWHYGNEWSYENWGPNEPSLPATRRCAIFSTNALW